MVKDDAENGSNSDATARRSNWTPRPDPTTITNERLRESEDRVLERIYEARQSHRDAQDALQKLIEARLDGMDMATRLLAETVTKIPIDADRQREHLRADIAEENKALRELVEARLGAMDKATELLAATVGRVPSDTDKAVGGLRELLGARIDGMDVATRLLAESVAQFPSDLDRAVAGAREYILSQLHIVREVTDEKIRGIGTQFSERDTRQAQTAEESKISLAAALDAAKEAVAKQNDANTKAIEKSELATQKQIDGLVTLMGTSNKSLEDKIADIKGRIDRGEGTMTGNQAAIVENRANDTYGQADRIATGVQARATISVAIAALSSLIAIVAIIVILTKH